MSTENINATEEVVTEIAEEAVETVTKNSHKGLKACGIVGCIAVAGIAAYYAVKKYKAKKTGSDKADEIEVSTDEVQSVENAE